MSAKLIDVVKEYWPRVYGGVVNDWVVIIASVFVLLAFGVGWVSIDTQPHLGG